MKQTKIPKGYRITVVSWENDADNCTTESVEGYTKEEAAFAAELFSKFNSCNDLFGPPGIGNLRSSDADIKEYNDTIAAVVAKHPIALTSKHFEGCFFGPEEDGYTQYSEYLYDLGLGGTEYSLTRVCESVKVEYIPEDIYIEDVTEQFVKSGVL